MEFNWYKSISNSNIIEQGDLIPNCPIIVPPITIEENGEYDVEVIQINSIILSQSCDLLNNKIEIVLVCPILTLTDFKTNLPESEQGSKAFRKHVENLKKGHLPGYHILNKDDNLEIKDYLVVDFRNVYGININNLKSIALNLGDRVRLNPPYREHLSQAFARYFMRVGLPQDLIIEGI
ncbi:hypothetical protein [Flavobacterium tibetense]|uniref:Uncharacterized protein n=1 Tax=Flavobacterium tibetense TaxID=2233533 RepID=A0A365P3E4_9FLAO|nr:hypothetical protein [Flavobacterium tibetense]RBA29024.1 hypothetical protein DPN68_04480 [Flavobacterium tibetense]